MIDYQIGTKVLGDWEIIRLIGEGSYGKVFELKKTLLVWNQRQLLR